MSKKELQDLVCDMIDGFEEGMRNCESDANDGVEGAQETYDEYCEILGRAESVSAARGEMEDGL